MIATIASVVTALSSLGSFGVALWLALRDRKRTEDQDPEE